MSRKLLSATTLQQHQVDCLVKTLELASKYDSHFSRLQIMRKLRRPWRIPSIIKKEHRRRRREFQAYQTRRSINYASSKVRRRRRRPRYQLIDARRENSNLLAAATPHWQHEMMTFGSHELIETNLKSYQPDLSFS